VAGGWSSKSRPFAYVRPEISLDCVGTMPTDCAGDRYGYHGNVFFELVSERYGGPATIREVFERAGALGAGTHQRHSVQAVSEVLAAHGVSLETAWNEYAASTAAGAYSLPGLATLRPNIVSAIQAGDTLADPVTVDHLAAKYVGIVASSDVCGKARLKLTVTVPAGVPAVPAFVSAAGKVTPAPANAPVEVPWNACSSTGTVALPNPTTTLDAATYGIETSVTRLPTAPPVLKLAVPKTVALPKRKPKLRFKLKSSGAGTVALTLSSPVVKARRHVSKGSNRMVLSLPKGFKAGKHTLTVTPISTSGAKGKTLKRTVAIRFKQRRR